MTTEIKLFSFVRLLFEKTLRIWPKYFSSDTVKTGVDILPLIHKCFPYQPFKNQVILP